MQGGVLQNLLYQTIFEPSVPTSVECGAFKKAIFKQMCVQWGIRGAPLRQEIEFMLICCVFIYVIIKKVKIIKIIKNVKILCYSTQFAL